MSISGIPSTIFSPSQSTSVTNTIQPEFQQLGQSLQSGNFVGAIGVCQFAAGVFAVGFEQGTEN